MNLQHGISQAANNDPDYLEFDRHLRQSLRPAAAPSKKDIEQDALIRSLEHETRELRVYVAALIRLLARKDAIADTEVAALVDLADRVQKDAPPRDGRHREKLRDFIRPAKNEPGHNSV